jgi:hypothetical protein
VKIDELPRKAVLGYLELTRLPLTAAERALGKTEGTWPLTIATDRVQATIKDVAGTILRDETLKADARLQHAALDERTRAAEAEAEADRIRAEADDRLRREKQAADEAKAEVARRDAQRDRAVDKQVGAKKATARKVAAAQDEALEQRATNATRETLAKESSAVREQRAALEAKAEALELEDELEAARAARKQQRSG